MYDYIRRTYGVDPVPGERAIFIEYKHRPEVVIQPEDPSMGHYVMARFPGQDHASPCHPKALEYLGPPAEAPAVCGYCRTERPTREAMRLHVIAAHDNGGFPVPEPERERAREEEARVAAEWVENYKPKEERA